MDNMSANLYQLIEGDKELSFHSEEVSLLAYHFGINLGLGMRDIKNLKIGGLIHDIGKTLIQKKIMYKPDFLTDEEFALIKTHPVKGHEILMNTNQFFSQDVIDIVLQHHERIDGRGYPYSLKGKDINPLAKMISLCDVYSAIIGVRSYKLSQSHNYALAEIESGFGTQFDKELGEKFIQFMENNTIKRHMDLL